MDRKAFEFQYNLLGIRRNTPKYLNISLLLNELELHTLVNDDRSYYSSFPLNYKNLKDLNFKDSSILFLRTKDITLGSYKSLMELEKAFEHSKGLLKGLGLKYWLNSLKEYRSYLAPTKKLRKLLDMFNKDSIGVAIIMLNSSYQSLWNTQVNLSIPYITINAIEELTPRYIIEDNIEDIQIIKKNVPCAYYQSIIDKYLLSFHFRNCCLVGD